MKNLSSLIKLSRRAAGRDVVSILELGPVRDARHKRTDRLFKTALEKLALEEFKPWSQEAGQP